jgi:hypothetical protein
VGEEKALSRQSSAMFYLYSLAKVILFGHKFAIFIDLSRIIDENGEFLGENN